MYQQEEQAARQKFLQRAKNVAEAPIEKLVHKEDQSFGFEDERHYSR